MFERIKRFYNRKLWTLEQVKFAASVGVITKEEFREITGMDYVA